MPLEPPPPPPHKILILFYYLTLQDLYLLFSTITMCIVCAWAAFSCKIIPHGVHPGNWLADGTYGKNPDNWIVLDMDIQAADPGRRPTLYYLDKIILTVSILLYIFTHIVFFLYVYFVVNNF